MAVVIVKVLIMTISIWLISWAVGNLFCFGRESVSFGKKIVLGQLGMWGLFFVCALPMVVLRWTLTRLVYVYFSLLMILILVIIFLFARKILTVSWNNAFEELSHEERIYLGFFLGIVLFILYKSVFYAYADGDDAFYVAVAQTSQASDTMYQLNPYSGFLASMNYRYAFAPFPMWIAMLSRVSGLNVATVAHVVMPLALIPMTFMVYNEIGRLFFDNQRVKRYVFLTLLAVITLFSYYSFDSAEIFMLTRSRQGKAALASLIIPAMLMEITEICFKKDEKLRPINYITILFMEGAAALASMTGNVSAALLVGFLFLYQVIFGKCGFKRAVFVGLLAIPPLAMAGLYFLM